MPLNPAIPPSAPFDTSSGIEILDQAVAMVQSRLGALADGRRRDTALTDGWQGGHRDRFDAAVREIELRTRRVNEALALVALAGRRASDEQVRW